MWPTLVLAVVHPAMPIEHPPVKIDPPRKEAIRLVAPQGRPVYVNDPAMYWRPQPCGPLG